MPTPDAGAPSEPDFPEYIGAYRVVRRVGAGGMGEVFEAEDPKLRRRVAIKCLRTDTAAGKDASRLLTEARAAARLDHPNICAIHEVGEHDGQPFIVMPLVDGDTLAARIAAGRWPVERAVAIAVQIADGLAAAHAEGVVHRDIKPANIMIDARDHARIMDFGLAKLVGRDEVDETVSRLTNPGTTLGTAAYMSPEQARGEVLDARSDLFSLGVVLYEMLAGVRPFHAANLAETYTALLTTEPLPVSALRNDVPPLLQQVLSKALRKTREDRHPSARDMAADLHAVAAELKSPSVSRAAAAPASLTDARRTSRFAIVAALFVLVAGGGLLLWRFRAPSPSPSPSSSAAALSRPIASLAVLPFVNQIGSADDEYLVDGITDGLIASLSESRTLKVISRGSVARFKGKAQDPKVIARQLDVDALVMGVVRRQGDQLVIDLEVSDAKDARVLFAHRYLQPAADVLGLESALSRDVAEQLRLTVNDAKPARATPAPSSAGYQNFLKGKFYSARNSPSAQHQAIEYFERAIASDPSYAPAYANLAQTHAVLGIYFEAPREQMPKAKAYAQQALDRDPDAVDARIVLGLVSLLYDWDWDAAATAVTAADGTIDPRAMSVFSCTAHILESSGRTGVAQQEVRRALAQDPLSVTLHSELGCTSYYRRQFDAALAGYREALALDDRDVISYWGLGRAYGQMQKYQEALTELERVETFGEPAPPIIVAEEGYAYAKLGRAAKARESLARLSAMKKDLFVDPYLEAIVHLGLGDTTAALDALERAYRERSGFLASLNEEPKWDALRGNPRFRALVKNVGLI